ncbi:MULTISPECIES: SDR family oxidoreductase [unclassified Massilia]|uniref:SDR family oxidoreductase n=1 Tax=unclassified Massilia TaxID=2609279 RepID=UPI001B830CC6|nr:MULTISPECIES: SDR family oxidoreductase [unclassified Massilia]MBQ5939406.1 SDR family NAD(P)-dependent oxidoreductase [Massilia sp. AB1]MBQ5961487.1 SDR family NAD(P)-dependent oxidoreductase [Massilia sp. ZL223]
MSSPLKPLNRQVIVITGATSGIGLATAQEAAKQGAQLVLAARGADVLDAVVARFNALGQEAVGVVADVSERAQVERIAEAAIARFGRIDTWVNNAGSTIYGRVDEVSEADARRLFDINFWGMVHGSLVALPHLKRQGGALINLGSEASEVAIPMQGMYSASKHAVKGFTDALRIEVEQLDEAPVSVTLIEPTAVDTPLPQHARNYMDREPKLPSPQVDPHQVAAAILHAAVVPMRTVRVGMMADIDVMMDRLLPGVSDRLAVFQVPRQQQDCPPRNPDGSLYASRADGRIYGPGGV